MSYCLPYEMGTYLLEDLPHEMIAYFIMGQPRSQHTVDVHINDNDDGKSRETKLSWSDESDKAHRNPSIFGFVRFLE